MKPRARLEPDLVAVSISIPLPATARTTSSILRRSPFAFLDLAPELLDLALTDGARFAWRAFDGAADHVAFGAARTVTAEGHAALASIAENVRAARPRVIDVDGRPSAARPRWFGGFAFDPTRSPAGSWKTFPAALFVLPTAQLALGRRTARLTVCGPAADAQGLPARAANLARAVQSIAAAHPATRADRHRSAEDPGTGGSSRRAGCDREPKSPGMTLDSALIATDPALASRLDAALRSLAAGEIAKVVVATSLSAALPASADAVSLARAAAACAPGCTAFLVAPTPSAAWLGATPERLVRVRGRRMWTMALAGTARRGSTKDEDGAIGAALLASDKDRREHQAVVSAVVGTLAAVPGLTLACASPPRLRRLATLQHLETSMTGKGEQRLDVLDLARRLHPTPALAGWPRSAAQALIAELEPEGRGWYGGGVGWVDGNGDGDLAVGIRALLVGGGVATAFAGAGLVTGSDARLEAREIGLKLATSLAPLHAALHAPLHARHRAEAAGDAP